MAAFELQITTTSGFSQTILDNSSADLDNGGSGPHTTGDIVFVGAAGGFSVTVSTAFSKPVDGSATSPYMDLNVVVTTIGNHAITDAITVSASDTDYGPLPGPGNLMMSIGGTQTSGSTVTYTASQDTANQDFGSTSSTTLGPISGTPFSATGSLSAAAATTYSLTQSVTIAYTNASGPTSEDATLTTPAPAGLLLAITGMPVLGFGTWLRRRRINGAA
jgi:hypothetical protein